MVFVYQLALMPFNLPQRFNRVVVGGGAFTAVLLFGGGVGGLEVDAAQVLITRACTGSAPPRISFVTLHP